MLKNNQAYIIIHTSYLKEKLLHDTSEYLVLSILVFIINFFLSLLLLLDSKFFIIIIQLNHQNMIKMKQAIDVELNIPMMIGCRGHPIPRSIIRWHANP